MIETKGIKMINNLKSQVECTKNYDPYYGFKVIQQGTKLTVETNTQSIVWTLLDGNVVVGTIYPDALAQHFQVLKGE